ncbi:fructosamine kinase family protein [Propioniciclava soli]|uniref:Fructosamine kinase family protein n=1 Tax=Propioniciclava soli TaxID=2775081 RepID=A0ABZ3C575_9ACTN|nr:fructosamine kinase family protein [Propioniciclava soli]
MYEGDVDVFRKHRPAAPRGFFAVEAAGLRWLGAVGAVRVAQVIDVGEEHIAIERLTEAAPTPAHAEDFGRDLAALHDAGAPAFGAPPQGWDADGFIGEAPLPLRTEATWGTFYARWRIEPYLAESGIDARGRAVLERLAEALASGTFDDAAPPARIHGDLWSGNVLWTPSGVGLIDPAAHGGHRITDLAMLALFSTPQLGRIHAAYAEASAHLPAHWRELVPLHQVHPLLVHAVLFGGGYRAQAVDAAQRALALAG